MVETKKVIPVKFDARGKFVARNTRTDTDDDEKFVLIKFVHIIRRWHLWMMGPGGSYSLQTYKNRKTLLNAFSRGDIHELWKGCFEDPMPYSVAIAYDNEE